MCVVPQISRFSPLFPQFSLSPSLWGLLVELLWCLKLRDPQMCMFGFSGRPARNFGRPAEGGGGVRETGSGSVGGRRGGGSVVQGGLGQFLRGQSTQNTPKPRFQNTLVRFGQNTNVGQMRSGQMRSRKTVGELWFFLGQKRFWPNAVWDVPTAEQDPTRASNCESAALSRTGKRWSDVGAGNL